MNIKSSYVISYVINIIIVFCIIQNSFYGNEHLIIKNIIDMIPSLYVIGIVFMSFILVILCFLNFIISNFEDYPPIPKDVREGLFNLHYYYTNKYMILNRIINNIFFVALFIITGHYFLCVLEIIIDIITYLMGIIIILIHDKMN